MHVAAVAVECVVHAVEFAVVVAAVEFVVVAVVDALLLALVGPAASPDPGCAA